MKPNTTPLIIAHRGAQSIYPEHTLKAYEKAIALGADFIEPDLVMTKEGVLVARHEPYISTTTNVADIPEFANRKTTKNVDGEEITDWFVSDFTLAELKKLKARQSWENRSHEFDDQFDIVTFEEVIAFAKAHQTISGKPVGIYPELKHPTYHKSLGLPMEDVLVSKLAEAGWTTFNAPVFIQCFEVATLQYLNTKTEVRLIQLLGASGISKSGELQYEKTSGAYDAEGRPFDFYKRGDKRTYEFFTTAEGMEFAASYADGLGPWKPFVIPYRTNRDGTKVILPPSDFVSLAHKNGLKVHPYTFRKEDTVYSNSGNIKSEYQLFFEAGVDGVFTDFTDEALIARSNFIKKSARE